MVLLGFYEMRSVPVHPVPLADRPEVMQESSSAQYILHQYTAASGGYRLLQSVRNAYAMGKVRMVASEFETATRVVKNRGPSGRGAAAVEQGGFVLWQMARRARRRRQQSPWGCFYKRCIVRACSMECTAVRVCGRSID